MKILIMMMLSLGSGKDPETYLDWYKSAEYPFRDTVAVGEIRYVCTWVPYEVELAREIVQQGLEKTEAKKRYKKRPDDFHFQLKILLPETGSDIFSYAMREKETATTRSQYFSFEMKQDLRMKITNGDSIRCNAFVHDRGMSNFPVAQFGVYFPAKENPEVEEVIFYDRIFTQRNVVFEYRKKFSNKIPRLNI